MKSNPLYRLVKVRKEYHLDGVTVRALWGVDLTIEKGELVAIVGPSGSGKSTLLHLLGFLDRPSGGKIYFAGQPVSGLSEHQLAFLRNQKIGFVFQQFCLLPRTTAEENVVLPAYYNPSLSLSEARKKARRLLAQLGLKHRLYHFPNQLSAGEQQRVAIARALLCDPEVILADEPTGNLDSKTGKQIVDILFSLKQKMGKTVIIVTHDLALANLTQRRVYLKDGQIIKEE